MADSSLLQSPDGRSLRLHLAGAHERPLVVLLHGTPSSGALYPRMVAQAEEAGVRLVGYDRPGYGGSDRQPGRSVADAATDVAAIADGLGAERFAVWGQSGGAPHVLACAAQLPERVAAAAAISGPAPYGAEGLDWTAGMGDENVEEFGLAIQGGERFGRYLEEQRQGILATSPEDIRTAVESLLPPVDRDVLTGELAEYLTFAFKDGLAPGTDGWADDDSAFVSPWGFDLAGIRVPLRIYHGSEDRFVPVAHARWLAGQIPAADVRILEGEGHLSLTDLSAGECFAWFAEVLTAPS